MNTELRTALQDIAQELRRDLMRPVRTAALNTANRKRLVVTGEMARKWARHIDEIAADLEALADQQTPAHELRTDGPATVAELEEHRDRLAEERDQLKSQLQHARAKVVNEGVYANATWYARTQERLRDINREFNGLLQRISVAKKEERRGRQQTAERAFIEVCRVRLAPDVFREYWNEAQETIES